MNREHRLKSLPPYFRAVVEGRKPFEIRKDDRAFDEGDLLVLCEWEPLKGFTGAEVEAPVTYVMRGGDLGLERGYAILGIRSPETYSPAPARESAPPLADDARVAGDVLCKCGDLQSIHAGGLTFCTRDDCWCLKFTPKEEASGTETEHRTDRALPTADERNGVLRGATAGGDHHVDPAGGGAGGESAGRRELGGPDGLRGGRGSPAVVSGRSGAHQEGGLGAPAAEGHLVQRHPEARALELAAQNLKDSHEDPEPRDQVAGVEGSTMREGPAHAPEQDREAGVQRPAGGSVPGEGATASPAAARWGRVVGDVIAWHLWSEGAGEAECGEVTDAEIEYLPENVGMDPERVCLDCKDLFAEMQAEEHQVGELNDNNATIVRSALSTPATKRKHRCAGFNKSAGLVCNTLHVHFEVDGKWFCKRHNPLKPKKARPAQEAAA